jgi:hypothetical protein
VSGTPAPGVGAVPAVANGSAPALAISPALPAAAALTGASAQAAAAALATAPLAPDPIASALPPAKRPPAASEPAQPRPLPPVPRVGPAATPAAPAAAPSRGEWSMFHRIGLGDQQPAPAARIAKLSQDTRQLIVTAYRLLGFTVLSVIVVVLVGYLATSVFYFVSDSWVQPMVVAPTDERILALEAKLTELEDSRDSLVAELSHVDRMIEMQQGFQAEFAEAIRADLKNRTSALERARNLAGAYAGARESIQKSNSAFARASRQNMSKEYEAGLIDQSDLLSRKYQLAQIKNSNLSLAERQAEYEERAAELASEANALNAILSKNGGEGALSYDVLRIKREYEDSRLENARALDNRRRLATSLDRQQARIDALNQSPYLRALAENANMAFVPYGNLDNVEVGAPVYSCWLEMLFCGEVGKVIEILPGEVSFKHPHRSTVVRGQMISIELDEDEADAAQESVLFVGGRPLMI